MVRMIMELVRNRSFTLTAGNNKQSRLCRLGFLFNIYMYDFPSMIFRKFSYADDLALLHSFGNWKDLEETLSQNISTLLASGGQYRELKYRDTVPWYFFSTFTGTVGTRYRVPVPRYFFYKVPRYSV